MTFVVCVLVSREQAQPRQVHSSTGANSSLNNSEGAPPSQSLYGGKPFVTGSSSRQNRRQQQQHYAAAYAQFCPEAWTGPTGLDSLYAAYRLQTGAGGQGRIYNSKDKALVYSQPRQTCGLPAGPSSQSPAMPQSASLNHPFFSRSKYMYISPLVNLSDNY